MTNREWLGTLTDREFIFFIVKIWPTIANGYADSTLGMINWLGQEHIPKPYLYGSSWITEQLKMRKKIL